MHSRTEDTNKAGHTVEALIYRVSIGPPLLPFPAEYSDKFFDNSDEFNENSDKFYGNSDKLHEM